MEHGDFDVVVVGAGLSGLAAARRLLAEDVGPLLVLDARDEPGGKCIWRTVGGHLVHPGPAWTAPTQDHIKALAATYGIAIHRIDVDGAKIARPEKGGVEFSDGTGPRLTGVSRDEFERGRGELSRLCEQVPASRPWDAADAERLDTTTPGSWIRSQSSDPVVQGALAQLFKSAAASPSPPSMLSVGAWINSCGGLGGLETNVDELFVGGVAAIPVAIARDLGERLRLSWPVDQISWSGAGVEVTGPRGTVSAKRAILAMSPADTRKIQFCPRLSTRRELLHRGWVTTGGIKMLFVYESPFWHRASADRPPIAGVINAAGEPATVLDQSPADGYIGVLAASLRLQPDEASVALSDDPLDGAATLERRVLDTLVRCYGVQARSPVGVNVTNWYQEPFISGCHGFAQPGVLHYCGEALREPIGPIHWAGTDTADVWINHMDGAVQAGERAAGEVATALTAGVY